MTGTDVATYTRERPGMSAFVLEDGVVYHTYSTYARGLDGLWGMYQWLDRAPKGRNETGIWWRRHDEYHHGLSEGEFTTCGFRASFPASVYLASQRCCSLPARRSRSFVWCVPMSAMGEMAMPGDWTMSMAWMRMPGQTWPGVAASFLACGSR